MTVNPGVGQRVRLHYRPALRAFAPHGAVGFVVIRSRGKPRNHGVVIHGRIVVVPCGNLMPGEPFR